MQKIIMRSVVVCACFVLIGLTGFSSAEEKAQSAASAQEIFKPRCSHDQDCARPGLLGVCQSPGEKTAKCLWQEIVKVPVTVIEPDQCQSCQMDNVVMQLRVFLPGLEVVRLKASEKKAKEIMERLKIKMLPAYILGKEIEQEITFSNLEPMLTVVDGEYYLKPEFTGVSYFSSRSRREDHLDLFLVMTAPGMYQSAKIAQELIADKKSKASVAIHFLGLQDPQSKKTVSPGGEREISEDKVFACVEKHYPQKAFDYLIARLLDMSNIWIDDVVRAHGCDVKKIKSCAQSSEGEKLYQEKIRLSQEIDVRYAPLFLMENVEIFGVSEKTTAAEVLKTLKQSSERK